MNKLDKSIKYIKIFNMNKLDRSIKILPFGVSNIIYSYLYHGMNEKMKDELASESALFGLGPSFNTLMKNTKAEYHISNALRDTCNNDELKILFNNFSKCGCCKRHSEGIYADKKKTWTIHGPIKRRMKNQKNQSSYTVNLNDCYTQYQMDEMRNEIDGDGGYINCNYDEGACIPCVPLDSLCLCSCSCRHYRRQILLALGGLSDGGMQIEDEYGDYVFDTSNVEELLK